MGRIVAFFCRVCPNKIASMATYSDDDLRRIAEVVGVQLAEIMCYRHVFEAAALWYRSDCRTSPRVAPHKIINSAKQISGTARKLLRYLKVYDYRNAADGPSDLTLLQFLASADDRPESDVIRATERVGRLAEIFDGIEATQDFIRWGSRAADDAAHIGRLTTLGGRPGDYAVNAWIAAMMSIYKALTGKEPRISQRASSPNRGKPSGPFFRFLEAARGPVEFEGKPLRLGNVRERVRALRSNTLRKK